jgi:hypothetical protein
MNFDPLSAIKRVEAPEHLFNSIQLQIEQTKMDIMPKKTALTILISIVLFLVVNALILMYHFSKPADLTHYAAANQLISSNTLYQ